MHTAMFLLYWAIFIISNHVVLGMVPQAVASLLQESPCTVVAYGLDKATIENIVSSMLNIWGMKENIIVPPIVTITTADFDLEPLKKISPCFIGLARKSDHGFLQMVLYPVHERQLIVIDDSWNQNSANASTLPQINPNHHPMIMLKNAPFNANYVMKEVACHDGRVVRSNVFRANNIDWTVEKDMVGAYPTERLCNNGNLPLHGKTVKASVFSMSPWVYTNDDRELVGGVVVEMFKVIAEYLEFHYEIVLRSNWFQFFANGTIGESVGDVLYGRADVSLEQHKEFAHMFGDTSTNTYFDYGVYIELKPKESPKYTNIVYPLDGRTWMWLAISFGAIAVVLYLIHTYEDKSNHLTITLTLQMTFGIIFQEYFLGRIQDKTSRFLQLRLLWVVLTMLITMVFAGNLKSSLVRKNYEKRTMTRDEMIDKDMIIHTSTTSLDWYKTPQAQLDPLNARLLCQAEKKKSIYVTGHDVNEQVSKLLLEHGGATSNFALSVEDLRSKYLKKGIDFPFVIIPEKNAMLQYGMFFQKYNPKASYFDNLIELMRDTGVTDYLLRQALPYQDMKEHIQFKEEKLIMEHFYLPQIFLLVGLLAGILTFVFEFSKRKFVN